MKLTEQLKKDAWIQRQWRAILLRCPVPKLHALVECARRFRPQIVVTVEVEDYSKLLLYALLRWEQQHEIPWQLTE